MKEGLQQSLFHAGMCPHKREEVREQFVTDVIEVTVATNLEKRLMTRAAFAIPVTRALS